MGDKMENFADYILSEKNWVVNKEKSFLRLFYYVVRCIVSYKQKINLP